MKEMTLGTVARTLNRRITRVLGSLGVKISMSTMLPTGPSSNSLTLSRGESTTAFLLTLMIRSPILMSCGRSAAGLPMAMP